MLTAKGIKPIGPYQHKFENTYLFGSFSPINGDSFMLEMPYCSSQTFQIYLDEFSLQKSTEFKIIILDNGAFHHAKGLQIPANMALLFLPPYSPELNPAEKIWRLMKDEISMTIHPALADLQKHLDDIIKTKLLHHTIKSICGNEFYKTEFWNCFNV
jgi:transposase